VADLIEINLMFAQLELSLGGGDAASASRALDHITEALRELRSTPLATPEDSGEPRTGEAS
jgi:hypothetical protein